MATIEESTPQDPAAAQLQSLQSAARWIVASSAAVLAVMAAGIQLTALSRVRSDQQSQWIAMGALVAALTAVGLILFLAARVLVSSWSLHRLAHLEVKGKWTKGHWMYDALQGQRGLLVADPELHPQDLYRRHHQVLVAWTQLHERGRASLPVDLDTDGPATVEYLLTDDTDVARLAARMAVAERATERVGTAAKLIAIRRRYILLLRALTGLGALIVAALLTFVSATTIDTAPAVTTPIPMQVHFTTSTTSLAAARLPRGCAGQTVDAVAVAGTLPEPKVITKAAPGCPPSHAHITPEIGLATPQPTK